MQKGDIYRRIVPNLPQEMIFLFFLGLADDLGGNGDPYRFPVQGMKAVKLSGQVKGFLA
jgi:hypothetical protein